MAIRFPTIPKLFSLLSGKFSPGEDTERYFRDYNTVLQREFDKRTPDDTTRGSLYLTSPDGSTWQISVDDAGALSQTKVSG